MRAIFADTGYWVAVIHPHDGLHERAMAVSRELGQCVIVTSEMVLVEVLNMFSSRGSIFTQFLLSLRQLAEFAEPLMSVRYTGPVHRWVLDTA
jgi:uncharacterized protein